MRRASFIAIASFALLQACTFFSGVEELELRQSSASSPDAAATGDAGIPDLPGLVFGGSDAGGAKPPNTGEVCGALGSWTACEIPTALTCAEQCLAKGLSCVESCCAYDELGDYPAKVGMVYATAGLLCEIASVPSTSSAGLCSDPILPLGGLDTRCCCR